MFMWYIVLWYCNNTTHTVQSLLSSVWKYNTHTVQSLLSSVWKYNTNTVQSLLSSVWKYNTNTVQSLLSSVWKYNTNTVQSLLSSVWKYNTNTVQSLLSCGNTTFDSCLRQVKQKILLPQWQFSVRGELTCPGQVSSKNLLVLKKFRKSPAY
jgi:phage-related protein